MLAVDLDRWSQQKYLRRMAEPSFEYDVFISFASGDEDLVRPLWQDLTLAGLRVFWSDATLRELAGSSWFDVIERSLERSRHLLLVCTPVSLASKWVKREYVAFLNHCHRPPSRLLVPILASSVQPKDLPLFLKELEACSFVDDDLPKHLIRTFGGVDVDALLRKVASLDEELLAIRAERDAAGAEVAALRKHLQARDSHAEQTASLSAELDQVRRKRDSLAAELAQLSGELSATRRRNDELISMNEAFHRERDRLLGELQNSRVDTDRLAVVQNELVMARTRLAQVQVSYDLEAQKTRTLEAQLAAFRLSGTNGAIPDARVADAAKSVSPLDFAGYAGAFLNPSK